MLLFSPTRQQSLLNGDGEIVRERERDKFNVARKLWWPRFPFLSQPHSLAQRSLKTNRKKTPPKTWFRCYDSAQVRSSSRSIRPGCYIGWCLQLQPSQKATCTKHWPQNLSYSLSSKLSFSLFSKFLCTRHMQRGLFRLQLYEEQTRRRKKEKSCR